MDSSQPQTYSALVSYYAEKNDLKTAQNYVDQGLKANKSAALYEIKAKLLLSDFATSGNKSLLAESESMYLKAIELSDSNFHSAMLKIKLSKLLVLNNDLELASKYIKEVRRYDFEDIAIIKEIDVLKGRLDQAKRRL